MVSAAGLEPATHALKEQRWNVLPAFTSRYSSIPLCWCHVRGSTFSNRPSQSIADRIAWSHHPLYPDIFPDIQIASCDHQSVNRGLDQSRKSRLLRLN